MLGLVSAIITRFVLWLASVLPLSPFTNMSFPSMVETALGWLNWFMPFGTFGTIFAAWLSVLVVAVMVRAIVNEFIKVFVKKSIGAE